MGCNRESCKGTFPRSTLLPSLDSFHPQYVAIVIHFWSNRGVGSGINHTVCYLGYVSWKLPKGNENDHYPVQKSNRQAVLHGEKNTLNLIWICWLLMTNRWWLFSAWLWSDLGRPSSCCRWSKNAHPNFQWKHPQPEAWKDLPRIIQRIEGTKFELSSAVISLVSISPSGVRVFLTWKRHVY